jgi:hypothetical protein
MTSVRGRVDGAATKERRTILSEFLTGKHARRAPRTCRGGSEKATPLKRVRTAESAWPWRADHMQTRFDQAALSGWRARVLSLSQSVYKSAVLGRRHFCFWKLENNQSSS